MRALDEVVARVPAQTVKSGPGGSRTCKTMYSEPAVERISYSTNRWPEVVSSPASDLPVNIERDTDPSGCPILRDFAVRYNYRRFFLDGLHCFHAARAQERSSRISWCRLTSSVTTDPFGSFA